MRNLGEKEARLAILRADHCCVADDKQDVLGHDWLPGLLRKDRCATTLSPVAKAVFANPAESYAITAVTRIGPAGFASISPRSEERRVGKECRSRRAREC